MRSCRGSFARLLDFPRLTAAPATKVAVDRSLFCCIVSRRFRNWARILAVLADTLGSGSFGKGFEELGEFDPTDLRVDFALVDEPFGEVAFEAVFVFFEPDPLFEPTGFEFDFIPFRVGDDFETEVFTALDSDKVDRFCEADDFDLEALLAPDVFLAEELA